MGVAAAGCVARGKYCTDDDVVNWFPPGLVIGGGGGRYHLDSMVKNEMAPPAYGMVTVVTDALRVLLALL